MRHLHRGLWFMASLALLVALIWGWQVLADARILPRAFFPGPDRTWRALSRGFASGTLVADTLTTLRRLGLGWVLASLLGVGLGALVGTSKWAQDWVAPIFEVLRPLPASAIAPVLLLFLGLTDSMILTLIAFGALWPMLLTTVHGFSNIHPRRKEVARSLGMGRGAFIAKIALPGALPDIMGGLRLGLTVALILVVVGEMITVQGGLGARILLAARAFNAAEIFAGVALLGVIGLVTNALLGLVETRALRWQRR
ncbi:ABC transporter permease [Pararhodobacter marinus]|uniref:ABC transporter permease n=1 Tax=Pararhodobacter marinus TaxID=2184063 RepID=A0A2U2C9K6_9RHOB|nr:ABC transporter permease [Pararhodobacter marinus]PWE28566.1 ABC transporter permease [Pararhodobacter marinus]